MSGDEISPQQSRAARRLLNWSIVRLASRSTLSESAIRNFEESLRAPPVDKLADIRAPSRPAGVEFTNGDRPGVRMRKGAAHDAGTVSRCTSAARLVAGPIGSTLEVHKSVITLFELGARRPYDRTLDDLHDAFEAAGVIFVEENDDGLACGCARPMALSGRLVTRRPRAR